MVEELKGVIWISKKSFWEYQNESILIVEKDKDVPNKEQIYFSCIFMSTQIQN